MATAGSGLRPRGKDSACEESPLPPKLARRIAALSGQGPATQDQPTPRRRALACRVAAHPQAAGVWRPVEAPRSTSEREREQFEEQTRAWCFFPVFSSGVGNRSEEHTSELQSHSFISYAVFCLK